LNNNYLINNIVSINKMSSGKICDKHEYGRHIDVICTLCRVAFHTKNIGYIGARSIFYESNFLNHLNDVPCDHKYEHVCDENNDSNEK
jgi:hypothetical protein